MTGYGPHRRLVALLSVVGASGAAVSVGLAVTSGHPAVAFALALALSWYVAGWVATRARPDHPEAVLLLAVGALHLGAFGLSAAAASAPGRWGPWLGEALAGALFTGGFGALALLFALYPDGQVRRCAHRVLARAVAVTTGVVAVLPPLTSSSLEPVLALRRGAVPPPSGLPLVRWDVDAFQVVPLVLVGAGVVVLVVSARRRPDAREAGVYAWPAGVGGMLALLLLATPSAVRLVGYTAWSATFVLGVAAVPWALLAGLTRYRLLLVDVHVTRALSRGALAVLGVSCYALGAAVLDDRASPVVAAGVVVVAALTGERLRQRLEALADRLITGGRVRKAAAEAELRHAGILGEPEALAGEVVGAVARGLEVSTVRLLRGDHVVASVGLAGVAAQFSVPIVVAAQVVGSLACGPRHGGWGPAEERAAREVAERVGLLWENAHLTTALAQRVTELEASRRRLVQAEEDARRALERDLHDGVQQQMVALLVRLELLRALVPPDTREGQVTAAARELAQGSLADLRELVRGIRPPLLADHGLVAALQSRAAQLPEPVTVEVDPRIEGVRYPADVESAAYFVALEALTNVLKHAGVAAARVVILPTPEGVTVTVSDEGRGFDALSDGTGLAGMRDRVEALGGSLSVDSAVGVGTTVTAHIPAQAVSHA